MDATSSSSFLRAMLAAVPRPRPQRHHLQQLFLRNYATAPRPYKIHVGASFAGKPPELRPKLKRKFNADAPENQTITDWRDRTLSIKKAFPSNDIGEDFFYIQDMRNQSGVSFGVADGVGGWVDVGVDPSIFAQALMYHAHRYSRNAWAGEPETDPTQNYEEREEVEGWEMTPEECLELAYGGVLRERAVEAGSSTACIININAASGLLRSANLGDSGFSIVRSSSLLHVQNPQTHFFNCPKQLSKLPAGSSRYDRAFVDSPQVADTYETKLRDGDLVVAYTDGFSDNVYHHELLQAWALVRRQSASESEQVQLLADKLVQYARVCMVNRHRVSPFEVNAKRSGMFYRGGKIDDVTVVAALIQERP